MSFSKMITERFVDLKYVSSKGEVFESLGSGIIKAWKKAGPMPIADVFADITGVCESMWDNKNIMCEVEAEITDDSKVTITITDHRDRCMWTGVFKMSLSNRADNEINEALYELGQNVYDQLESRI